jgi:tRNA-dependent cyclodipeptide synthase
MLHIEVIPDVFKQDSCIIAVCLAKNNPLLVDDQFARDVLRYTSDTYKSVMLLICDEINILERLISNGTTPNQARKLALSEGERIQNYFEKLLKELGNVSLENVKITRWKEIETTQYHEDYRKLDTILNNSPQLQSELKTCASFYIGRRNPDVTITPKRIELFSQYIMREMVVQLFGVNISDRLLRLIIHPVYIPDYDRASEYQSPLLDLKKSFYKAMSLAPSQRAFTARIYLES